MYNLTHLIYILVLTFFICVGLFLVNKFFKEKLRTINFVIAIIITVAELIKIGYLHYQDTVLSGYVKPLTNRWIPLSFCSLFIYASWLSISKNPVLQKTGSIFLITGGLFAGTAFLAYPSTAIALYPPLSFLSLHGMIYHALMVFCGLINLFYGKTKPTINNLKYYLLFVLPLFVIAIVLSYILGINLMFFRSPFGLPQIIKDVFNFNRYIYMALVAVAYISLFFVSCLGYKLYLSIKRNKKS